MENRFVIRKLKNCPTGAEVRYPWANDWLTVIAPKRLEGLVLLRDRGGHRFRENGDDRVYLDLESLVPRGT